MSQTLLEMTLQGGTFLLLLLLAITALATRWEGGVLVRR